MMNVVELKNITKRFANVVANDNIDFSLRHGEIHALLGENGAGKSTLMNILSGRYRPESGKIYVNGKEVIFKSPRDAINAGIGMIHQHFMLVSAHTVLDNIIMGMRLPTFLHRKKLQKDIAEFCQGHDFNINLKARIWQLSVGEQQNVEIIKTLYQGAEILILDEPTSVLTPQESETLFKILKAMRDRGYSIIFISHKLDEVLAISDRITVLRKGKLVDTVFSEGVQKKDLAKLMVSKDVLFDSVWSAKIEFSQAPIRAKTEFSHSREILRIEKISAKNDRGLMALNHLSLSLLSGEILGIAGVTGNGQTELAEVTYGLRKVESGKIYICGQDICHKTVKEIVEMGVGYIPADRIGVGSVANLDITDNILLRCYDEFPIFDRTTLNDYSEELAKKFAVVYSTLSSPVKHLSGGNLQKLIIARELRDIPQLLIAVYPTRGLDVGAIEYIRNVLIHYKSQGCAILFISEDLDELLAVSDRLAVIYEGKLTFMDEDTDVNQIGLAMAGVAEGGRTT